MNKCQRYILYMFILGFFFGIYMVFMVNDAFDTKIKKCWTKEGMCGYIYYKGPMPITNCACYLYGKTRTEREICWEGQF